MTRPDVTLLDFHGHSPELPDDCFVAPGCRLIGQVSIGEGASIWYNCVLRGDVNRIRIGARTNIQDGSVVHVDGPSPSNPAGSPAIIGDDVLIGHLAIIHGSVLHDRAFVGMGATVLDATIESDGMLAAGGLLTPGKVIPAGQLWGGRPARFMRDLSPVEIAGNQAGVRHYVENGRAHRAALGGVTGRRERGRTDQRRFPVR